MPSGHTADRLTHVAKAPEMAPTNALDRATQISIAAARAAQRRERAAFFKATGLQVDRNGRPMLFRRLVGRGGRRIS
jgi:hypothetical protein